MVVKIEKQQGRAEVRKDRRWDSIPLERMGGGDDGGQNGGMQAA